MKKKALSLIFIFALLLGLAPYRSAASDQTATALTAAISKNGSYIELKCTLSESDLQRLEGRKLSLYSVPIYAEKTVSGVTAQTGGITPAKEIALQTAYSGDLTCGYVLAVENEDGTVNVVTNYAYVTNPDSFAEEDASFFIPRSKKGLDFTMFADAQLLGVANTVIKVPLNEFITDDSDAFRYRTGTKYCYVDRDKLDTLDRKVKLYSEAGMRVFLQFVLTARAEGQPEYLYFPNANAKAEYFAINMTDRKTADVLFAFTSFIVNRYAASADKGSCASIILGYEVNSNRSKNSAGPMPLYDYTEKYAAALRTVDSAARSVCADARVYVSLDNRFNKNALGEGADPALDYSVTDFITRLAACISEEGDFPWRAEVHARNTDGDPLFMNKPGSEYAYEADYLTMDNINVMTSLLSRPAFLYNGQRRTVVINEVSYGSGANTEAAQKAQAAAFCLAYYKAEANDQIEAFIYGDQCDTAYEPNNCGLYRRKNGTDADPAEKKPIYNVFKYIDTDSSRIVAEPYLSVLPASSWGAVVSGYNGSAQMKARIITGTGSPDGGGAEKEKAVSLTDFSQDTGGFYPSENARMIESEKDVKGKELYGGDNSVFAYLNAADPHEYRGISAVIDGGADISGSGCALVDLQITPPGNVKATDVMLRLSGTAEDGTRTVYEGTAQITSDSYHRLYFNISEFSSAVKTVDRISVWIKPHNDKENGEYILALHGISVTGKGQGAGAGAVLVPALIIAGAVAALIAAVYAVIFIKTRKQYKKRLSVSRDEEL